MEFFEMERNGKGNDEEEKVNMNAQSLIIASETKKKKSIDINTYESYSFSARYTLKLAQINENIIRFVALCVACNLLSLWKVE